VVASGNSIVLYNEESTGCRGSHAKGSTVRRNEYDTGSQSLGACNDVVAADWECRTSRACQFLPLLKAMKATKMAN
jgi:hypothetical protein